ncbi:MAG TPA: molybdopterin molybdotransferase MoeA [Pyrinomonadaceae bacterium]|nr:molybdopterin molybdotransferase MoeA [Pyrinomonadaceae bacterium]
MISIEKALAIISRQTKPLSSSSVSLNESLGRVLVEDIIADSDLPPFDRSQMDGYALKAADTTNAPVELRIVGEAAAGKGWHNTLKRGEAVRIMTGGPVPKGANSVQKVELAKESNGTVHILEPTETGRFIVKKGAEVKKGKKVLKKGEALTVLNISLAAAFGCARVKVSKRPRVAIFTTGTEIVDIHKKPKADQIRNTNSVMLASLCEAAGAEVTVYPTVGDDISGLRTQIREAAAKADILVTTGGVSVGKYDLTKIAFKELGADIFFERVALKPGKPTVFGRFGQTLIFGLPGNPVSAAVTFFLFVRKAILLMQSALDTDLREGRARSIGAMKGTKERDSYLPAILTESNDGSRMVKPVEWKGSSDIVGFSKAGALVYVPRGTRIDIDDVAKILYL